MRGTFSILAMVLAMGGEGQAQRRLLLLDEGRKALVLVDEGNPSAGWTRALGPSRGLQLIGNDRVLVSTPGGYLEAGLAGGEVLLRVERWSGIEDARRLPNGHVLLGGNIGGKITLIEVDQNYLEVRRAVVEAPISKGMRQMRIGEDGNLYIAADDKVHVTDLQGRILRSLAIPQGNGSYQALRAADGSVYASSGYAGTVVRLSATGALLKTWAIPDSLKSPVAADPNFLAGFQVLANGNLLATAWHGHSETAGGHGKALIEFTPEGQVAWSWDGAGKVSSLHNALRLDGIETGILNDERSGPVKPLAYAFPAIGPGLPKVTWAAAELFKEVAEYIVPPAPPDTTSAYPNGNNYVTMYKGYMLVPFASDHMLNQGGFQFWDLGDLRKPKPAFTHNDKTTRNIVEVHGYGFVTVGGRDYACFQDHYGISIWDFTDIRNLKKISTLALPGIGGGGYDNGVFGVFWQHPYVYAAGSTHGVFVIDTRDVTRPKLVKQIPGSTWGGFRIGNTWAIGNMLLASTVRGGNNRGLAFFDIGNPANPVLVSVPTTQAAQGFYSAHINGNKVYLTGDERAAQAGAPSTFYVYELFDYPNLVLEATIPGIQGTGEYQFVQDENVIVGMEELWLKASTRYGNYRILGTGKFPETTFHGQQEGHPTPLGNVISMGDDHTRASGIHVHDVSPDNRPPIINMVVPANGALSQPITSRVGVSFSDQIDIQSVHAGTFLVRPKGGRNLEGHYSVQQYIANFSPAEPLLPDQVYEVVIQGVKDVSGNAMSGAFVAAFSTGKIPFSPPGQVVLKGGRLAVAAPGAPGQESARSHDLNATTCWQSTGSLPAEMVLDLKEGLRPYRLKYYPRKGPGTGGSITRYEVRASSDQSTWTKVAEGDWDGNSHTKYAEWTAAPARYVKLTALAGTEATVSACEFAVEAETGAPVAVRHASPWESGRAHVFLPHFGRIEFPDVGPVRRIEVFSATGRRVPGMVPAGRGASPVPRPEPGLYILKFMGERGETTVRAVL